MPSCSLIVESNSDNQPWMSSEIDQNSKSALVDFGHSMEKKESEFVLEEGKRNQHNVESNAIETTLFLQNHEKISLISSLAPIDSKELGDSASTSSTYSNQKQCRICLLCHETRRKRLISPCRCNGSIKYAHTSCLVRWIDTSTKRVCPGPRCEICDYKFKRRSLLSFDSFHMQFPTVGFRDKVLNFLFFLLVLIMAFCGWVSIHYLSLSINRSNAFRVSQSLIDEDDLTMFAATILFFVAFALAIFTQYRAETSLAYIVVRCWTTNRNWQIQEYTVQHDQERQMRSYGDTRLVPKSTYSC